MATTQELRDLYEESRKVLTRRKKTLHRVRMRYRAVLKRKKQREALTAKRKRKWLAARDGSGRAAAVKWALSQVGVHETPGLPNQGPEVNRWNAAVGMVPGPYAYWCGSFVHACLKAGGLDFPDWIRYTPSIYTNARNGQFGLSITNDPQAGDIVLMNFDGGLVDHVGLYIGGGETVEGNTSPGTGGSQNNGGGVYKRSPRGAFTYVHVNYQEAPPKVAGQERH